ncbi:hypothetical protein [Actinotalea sp.]
MMLVLLLAAVVVPPLVQLPRLVRADGLGHRPPPGSHLSWDVGTTLEVRR